jgi:hypothetical protein
MRPTPKVTAVEATYALLALIGLAGTVWFNTRYAIAGGDLRDPIAFFRLGFVNAAASSLTLDLLVAFVVFALWSVIESRRIDMRFGWAYPLLGLVTAFAFVLPLYLLLRERHLRTRTTGRS